MEEMQKKQQEDNNKKFQIINTGKNNNQLQQKGNALVRNRTMVSSVMVPNSLCDINARNPYEDGNSSMRKSSFDKEQNQMNINDFNPNFNQMNNIQTTNKNSNAQMFEGVPLKQYPLYNHQINTVQSVNKVVNVLNPYGDLSLDFKQIP